MAWEASDRHGFARAAKAGGVEDEQAGGVDAGVHVGQQVGDALVLDDRLVELNPIARVSQRRFKGRTGDAQGLCGDADAAAFQVGQGDGQAFTASPQQIGLGDGAVAQGDRAGVRRRGCPFCVRCDQR